MWVKGKYYHHENVIIRINFLIFNQEIQNTNLNEIKEYKIYIKYNWIWRHIFWRLSITESCVCAWLVFFLSFPVRLFACLPFNHYWCIIIIFWREGKRNDEKIECEWNMFVFFLCVCYLPQHISYSLLKWLMRQNNNGYFLLLLRYHHL